MPPPIVWLLLVWLFAVGGCIGSFMNVVIYRLPAGLSLLYPPSRCANCETPIRVTDNVPIFGWLWLRGRCRSCGAAISIRYPVVELLVALLFVGLAWVEPLSGGGNLPGSPGSLSMAELWGVYAYHLFLLCSLICAAFTELDGQPVTWRLALPALAVGILTPLLWPHLRPTPDSLDSWDSLVHGLIGAATGGLMGYAISWAGSAMNDAPSKATRRGRKPLPRPLARRDRDRIAHRPRKTRGSPRRGMRENSGRNPTSRPDSGVPGSVTGGAQCGLAIALAWTGAFLGWPAAIALGAVSVGACCLLRMIGRCMPAAHRIGLVSLLAAWTLTWLALWRQIQAMLP